MPDDLILAIEEVTVVELAVEPQVVVELAVDAGDTLELVEAQESMVLLTQPTELILEVTEGAGGTGECCPASQIPYDHPVYSTVQEALDALLYIPIDVSGASTGLPVQEDGVVVSAFTLSWSINRTPTSLSISPSPGPIPTSLTSYSFTGLSITTTTTFTVTAGDGTSSDNASATIQFQNKRWWGTSAQAVPTQALVQSLQGEFATSRVQTKTLTPSGPQYYYFAWPASFGTPTFIISGLVNNAWIRTDLTTYVNQAGKPVQYAVYRSQFIQNGAATVSVQ